MASLLKQRVKAYERRLIDEALQRSGGPQSRGYQRRAAKVLGVGQSYLSLKLSRDREPYPDPQWDDAPLAWAVRRDRDRVIVAPCWTRDEINADAHSPETIALVVDEGAARRLVKDVNTTIAVRAAIDAETVDLGAHLSQM